MSTQANSRSAKAIFRYMVISGVSIAALVFGAGGWAATSNLSGAVVVEGYVKRIQHRDGGIVGEISVRDGQQVKAGELLIRLDDTITRATLAVSSGRSTSCRPAACDLPPSATRRKSRRRRRSSRRGLAIPRLRPM